MYGRNVGKTYAAWGTWGRNVQLKGNTFFGNNYLVQQQSDKTAYDLKHKQMVDIVNSTGKSLKAWAASFTLQLKEYEKAFAAFAEKFKREQEEKERVREELMQGPGMTPDIAGSVIGYRAFGVRSWYGPKLWPVAHGSYEWKPGSNEAVLCPNEKIEPHPYPWCDCGFWAMWDPIDIPYGPLIQHQEAEYVEVMSFGDAKHHWIKSQEEGYVGYVWGQIEAWGVVVEATEGFRAQFAKVTELYYPPSPGGRDYIHSLGVAYGVPVREPNFDFNYD